MNESFPDWMAGLTTRAKNALCHNRLTEFAVVAKMSERELRWYPYIGKTTAQEIALEVTRIIAHQKSRTATFPNEYPTSSFRRVSTRSGAAVQGIRAPVLDPQSATEVVQWLLSVADKIGREADGEIYGPLDTRARIDRILQLAAFRTAAKALHAAADLPPEALQPLPRLDLIERMKEGLRQATEMAESED